MNPEESGFGCTEDDVGVVGGKLIRLLHAAGSLVGGKVEERAVV